MKYIMNIFAWALLMGMVMSGWNIAHAETAPAYMKDAVITVKTKDGKEYTFSGNEFKVVKRGEAPKTIPFIVTQPIAEDKVSSPEVEARHKHIISLEIVRSKNGFDESMSSSTVDVKSRYDVGVGLMYQNNFYKDYYLGGRIDTNSGAGINIGIGIK